MDDAARLALEAELRQHCDRGDHDGAATVALRAYGPEIFGFLVAIHRDDQDAADVFSIFSESLWRGLPRFGWACTLRAWAYTIARNASFRFRKNARRDAKNRVPLTGSGAFLELAQKVRTETLSYLRTEKRDRFAAIRASLPPEDQALLVLRVDRQLSWDELARVMSSDEGEPSAEELKRESARLRKRYQLVKQKLLTLGERAGLVTRKAR